MFARFAIVGDDRERRAGNFLENVGKVRGDRLVADVGAGGNDNAVGRLPSLGKNYLLRRSGVVDGGAGVQEDCQ